MSEPGNEALQELEAGIDTATEENDPTIGGDLRRRAARGTIINTAFQVGLAGLSMLQRLLVAAFLTREEYGLWGILIATLVTLIWLKEIGIADKYVQQTESDQELAFQKAFTLELIVSMLFFVFVLAAMPLYALAYGHSEILVPGIVLALSVPISAFKTPIWVSYRRMQYVRQRVLSSVDPIVAFAVTVTLGVSGAGYWSLVIGIVAGSVAGALAATVTTPYAMRLRFDRSAAREYASFSWPLAGFAMSSLLIVQGTLLVANESVGLAGIGAIGLAGVIAGFTDRVDRIVSQTIYPAICRVADRTEVLHEAFVKSNRVTLMWSVPFGVGLALFAGDLITYGLGEKWRAAEGLLIAIGLIAAFQQVAFNWTIFMRARNETKPIFAASLIGLATFALVTAPALFFIELEGYVIGLAVAAAVQLVVRGYFLRRIFEGFAVMGELWRAIAPSIPAAGLILLIRAAEPFEPSLAITIVELFLYVTATAVFTLAFERALVTEMIGYLRRRPAVGGPTS